MAIVINETSGYPMRTSIGLSSPQSLDQVEVGKNCQRLCFLFEAVDSVAILREISGQNFHRNCAPKLRVLRQIHLTHSALANLRANFVTAEFCAAGDCHYVLLLTNRSLRQTDAAHEVGEARV